MCQYAIDNEISREEPLTFVQMPLKLGELLLLEANVQGYRMLGRCWPNGRPFPRHIVRIFDGERITCMERGAESGIGSEEEGKEGGAKGELHFGVSIGVKECIIQVDSKPSYLYLKNTSQ